MNALLKIVGGALTTASILGVISQSTVRSSTLPVSMSSMPESATLVAAFVPDPTPPPMITQGSGTR